jgi:hypothetical protein
MEDKTLLDPTQCPPPKNRIYIMQKNIEKKLLNKIRKLKERK